MDFGRKVFLAVSAIGLALLAASIFFFYSLDNIVHQDLYSYGLEYSDEWAVQYWAYKNLVLVFILFSGIANVFGVIYHFTVIPSRYRTHRALDYIQGFERKLSVVFLFGGGVAFALAILYDSTPMAFAGLGLVFWGSIFLYLRADEYIKEALLEKTALPCLKAIDQLLKELDLKGQAVYLPPKYLKDVEGSRVFIARAEGTKLPGSEAFTSKEDDFLIGNAKGISFIPPGTHITKLLESKLGMSFTTADLRYFMKNVPRILVEDIEIAQNVEIESREDKYIEIKTEDTSYEPICSETLKLKTISSSIGCPFCSALACALAKVTGEPIVIEEEQTIPKSRAINVRYRILREK